MNNVTRAVAWTVVISSLLVRPGDAIAQADDAPARRMHDRLMDLAARSGRPCMIATGFGDESLDAIRAFAKAVVFTDMDPGRPIQVILPEEYYNPLGRTVTFDEFALAVNRADPTQPFVSMTRTAEGVRLETNVTLETGDGRILCVRSLSATVKYRVGRAPADAK